MARIASIHRYPVKGLSPEALDAAALTARAFFPGDRLFALENGPGAFDPAAPAFQPKTRFLMLMKNARLAKLRSRYDDAGGRLRIEEDGDMRVEADVRDPQGRAALEAFFETYCAGETRGRVRFVAAPEGFRFTDSIRSGFVSILNLASVRDLERRIGAPLDPLRFRANLAVEGWEAWREEELVGRDLRIGDAQARVLKTIDRCPATHVDPATGARDLDVMGVLKRDFGRLSCGIYVGVRRDGGVRVGDAISILDEKGSPEAP